MTSKQKKEYINIVHVGEGEKFPVPQDMNYDTLYMRYSKKEDTLVFSISIYTGEELVFIKATVDLNVYNVSPPPSDEIDIRVNGDVQMDIDINDNPVKWYANKTNFNTDICTRDDGFGFSTLCDHISTLTGGKTIHKKIFESICARFEKPPRQQIPVIVQSVKEKKSLTHVDDMEEKKIYIVYDSVSSAKKRKTTECAVWVFKEPKCIWRFEHWYDSEGKFHWEAKLEKKNSQIVKYVRTNGNFIEQLGAIIWAKSGMIVPPETFAPKLKQS